MRVITSHQTNGCNRAITIGADDRNPAHGNASHDYRCAILDVDGDEMDIEIDITHIEFQNGPIKEVGVNGLTHEVLFAILIDRFECFQDSQWECQENADTLVHLRRAVQSQLDRTKAREARGVEGTKAV